MNIFFDLDGTLLDSRERLYGLFQQLVPGSKLSFDDYWKLKRNKIAHQKILTNYFSYSDQEVAFFEKEWIKNIELPVWLELDKPFDGVTNYLKELKGKHQLFVVTARQYESIAIQQIGQHGWYNIFEKVLVTCQQKEKSELIKTAVKFTNQDWMVGDTGHDIQTGKQLGINTAAVLSGFMNKARLEEYHPDIIVDNVLDIVFEPAGV